MPHQIHNPPFPDTRFQFCRERRERIPSPAFSSPVIRSHQPYVRGHCKTNSTYDFSSWSSPHTLGRGILREAVSEYSQSIMPEIPGGAGSSASGLSEIQPVNIKVLCVNVCMN